MPLPPGHPLYTYTAQYETQLWTARSQIAAFHGIFANLGATITWSDPVNGAIWWGRLRDALTTYMQNAIASNWLPDIFPQLEFMRHAYDYWGGDVDMDSVLSAMVAADTDQVTYFVGLIDAYRVGIWNRPFNAEFFAALARGWTP